MKLTGTIFYWALTGGSRSGEKFVFGGFTEFYAIFSYITILKKIFSSTYHGDIIIHLIMNITLIFSKSYVEHPFKISKILSHHKSFNFKGTLMQI